MEEWNKMNPLELIRLIRNIPPENFKKLVQQKEKIKLLELDKLNILFLNANDEYKKVMLDDKDLFDRLMKIPCNRVGKSIIDLSDEKIQEYIYHHKNLPDSVSGKKLVAAHLKKMNADKFTTLLFHENLNQAYDIDTFEIINQKFSLTPYQSDIIKSAIQAGNFSNIALFQIHNVYELFIYSKFGILVDASLNREGYLKIGEAEIKYDFIEKVNRKHIISLLAMARAKEEDATNNKLFIGIMKLYMLVGLDNSKKIINDFFTYSTALSEKRASDELFKDLRREFRLKNQNKFYYYGMEVDLERALKEKDYSFFETLCDRDKEYVEQFIHKVQKAISQYQKRQHLEIIKSMILEEIFNRERYYYQLDTKKYVEYYKSIARKEPIKIEDIYQLFADIDLNYQLSDTGKLIVDAELIKFLLGNCKKDNDCLLRMVMNRQALGLNDELDCIFNSFDQIKEIILNEPSLSLSSILDVIDISKVFLYHLKPDELDITLATLSKILNSRKHCTEAPEVILERVMTLHKDRKKRVASTIPMVSGKINGGEYRIANFDEEELLVSGIDSGSCLKVGGKGEDFFRFCLTNPKGFVFYIEYNSTKYVLPATVNGNMLNINSIDPKVPDKILYENLMKIIREMAKKVVLDEKNQVELVTITDVHHKKYMNEQDYEKVSFEKFIPLHTDVYCDYNKSEVTNYCLYKKDEHTKIQYFDNNDLFFQKDQIPIFLLQLLKKTKKELKFY